MPSIDEILERTARDVRADVRAATDVESGLAAIMGRKAGGVERSRRSLRRPMVAAAGVAAVVAVALLVMTGSDPGRRVVPGTEATSAPTLTTGQPSTSGGPPTTAVAAASCDPALLLPIVKGLFPESSGWNPSEVAVVACTGGFVQLDAIFDQTTCPTTGVPCRDSQQVWLEDIDGVWTFLDAGTGIGCHPEMVSPSIAEACAAFAATVVTLALPPDAATLTPRFIDASFDGPVAALAPDGVIVMSVFLDDGIALYSLIEGQTPVDTGVRLSTQTSLQFGPGGDLFAVEHLNGFTNAVVSRFGRTDDGRLVLKDTVSGPITGECGIVVEPAFAGCPTGTGPQIVIDPAIPFEQVVGDPLLAGTDGFGQVERTGSITATWNVQLDLSSPVNCDGNSCASQWHPGPSGSAVFVPYLEDPDGGNHLAVFVVDDRSTVTGARLEPLDWVLGVRGNELIGVQFVVDQLRLVAFDLTPLLP